MISATALVQASAPWYAPFTVVIFPLAASWVAFIGLSSIADRIEQSKFSTTAGDDRWVDVTADAEQFHSRSRRVRTGRVIGLMGTALAVWAAALLQPTMPAVNLVAVLLVAFLVARTCGPYLSFGFVAGFGIVLAASSGSDRGSALFLLAVAVWVHCLGRRWRRRVYASYRRGTDRPTIDDWLVPQELRWASRRVSAFVASALVALAFVVIVYTYLSSKWALLSGASGTQQLRGVVDKLPLGRLESWTTLVVALAKSPFGAAEALLIVSVGLLFRLNGFVLRLWVPEAWEVVRPESSDAIVYLRNFADDGVHLRAGTYTRRPLFQVMFDVLVPVRRRRFEQVLADLLRRFGPVIAAADPGHALPTVGTLKAALSHETWRSDVRQWCERAQAIVVSATPTQVNNGLREELRLLSEDIGHERIVLVVGPGQLDDVRARFATFKSAFPTGSKLLDDLDDPRVADGTLVMVRVPGHGWDCWGARYRTEAAYAVALDEAMKYGQSVWSPKRPLTSPARPGSPPPQSDRGVPIVDVEGAPPDRSLAYVATPLVNPRMPPGVELVPDRLRARKRPPLGMRCDNESVPSPIGDVDVVGRWSATAELQGIPDWQGHDPAARLNTASVCVTDHRLYAIMSAFGVDEEVWISVRRDAVSPRSIGRQGTVRSRPAKIEITGKDWTLRLENVDRLVSRDRCQSAQEASLFHALTARASAQAAPDADGFEDPVLGDWRPIGSLPIFVQTVDGRETGATALVDPTAPIDDQVEGIRRNGWIPPSVQDSQIRRLMNGLELPREPPSDGRLRSPVGFPFLAVVEPTSGPLPLLRRYLWPTVDDKLEPQLDEGERRLAEWKCERPTGYWVENDLKPVFPGFHVVPQNVANNVAWTLTDRRLILRTLGRSRLDVGVLHIRFEWLCGVNAERYDYLVENKASTLSISVVFGDRYGRRASIRLNPGMASDPECEAILRSLIVAIRNRGVSIGDRLRRTSDNGAKGRLTWDFEPVNGDGLTVARHVVEN